MLLGVVAQNFARRDFYLSHLINRHEEEFRGREMLVKQSAAWIVFNAFEYLLDVFFYISVDSFSLMMWNCVLNEILITD